MNAVEAARAAYNAPILAKLPDRTRAVCDAYLRVGSFRLVAEQFGLSSERIRQIVAPALLSGLDMGKPLKIAKHYIPNGRGHGRLRKIPIAILEEYEVISRRKSEIRAQFPAISRAARHYRGSSR